MMYKNIANTFVFDSGIPGKSVAVFGWVHGNEVAGVAAVKKCVDLFEKKRLVLRTGKIVFALANERAMEINERQLKFNLNRLFTDSILQSNDDGEYEKIRAKELVSILDDSDALLDIHSTSSESDPFVFAESGEEDLALANALRIGKTVVWWSEICGDIIDGDTQTYMAKRKKIGVTLECGWHHSPNAAEVWFHGILEFLHHFGLLDERENFSPSEKKNEIFRMYKIAITGKGEFRFSKKYQNFDPIARGEIVGSENGKDVVANEPFTMLLPNYERLAPGKEIFYYGASIR